MQSVYVAGVAITKFGKDPRTLSEIFCDAARSALGNAESPEVDAIYIGTMNPEEFTGDSNIASLIADATESRCWAEMRGPISDSAAEGSVTRNDATAGSRSSRNRSYTLCSTRMRERAQQS